MRTRCFTRRLGRPAFGALFCVLAVGCGEGEPAGAGGGGGDDGASTSTGASESTSGAGGSAPDPEGASVIEVVDRLGAARAGVDVVVSAEDGSVILHVETGPNGSVEVDLDGAASVSMFSTDAFGSRSIQTAYLEGGSPEKVRFVDQQTMDVPVVEPMWLRVWSNLLPHATHHFVASCYQDSNPSTLGWIVPAYEGCKADTYDVAIAARNASGALIDYGFALNLPFKPQGEATHYLLLNGANPIDEIPFEIVNIPPAARWAAVSTSGRTATAILESEEIVESPGTVVRATVGHPSAFGDKHCQIASVSRPAASQRVELSSFLRCAPELFDEPVLFDASKLARYEVQAPGTSPFEIIWTEADDGEQGDFVRAVLGWGGIAWTVYRRPGAGNATMPELPDELSEYRPDEGATLRYTDVHHANLDAVDGFEAFLATGVWDQNGVSHTSAFYLIL